MPTNVKTYAITLVASPVLVLTLVAGANALVDPFGMYRWLELQGINVTKPAIYNRVRLLKAYEVRRLRPDSVVLGSSRVHLGMRPSHSGWSQRFNRPYNLGFDGALTKEMYRYLVHAHAAGGLRHVMLGLDTYHLTEAPGTTRPGFDQGLLLGEDSWLNPLRATAADLKLLINTSTLQESLNTIKAQERAEPVWLASDGQRLGEVFFRRPGENFQKFGPRYYFDEIDQLEIGYKLDWRIPTLPLKRAAPEPTAPADPITSLGYIQEIITYCRRHEIALTIFLTPSHTHQLELSAATGDWQAVENGKRALVSLVADDTRRHPDRPPIQVWDFSGYSSVTGEPLPPPNTHREMQYYWDSSHFKEVVGDWVLDRLLNTQSSGQTPPDDFGYRLTPEAIERLIAEERDRQAVYRRERADEVQRLDGWVADYKREHGIVD